MVKLPPPVWVVIFVAVAAAVSALLPWRSIVDLRVVPLGIALMVAGLVLPVWAVLLFRREGTELNPTAASSKAFVVRGPYAITRNPMYLGLTIEALGLAFWVGSLPMFVVPVLTFAIANWVHIPFEEAKMHRQFDPDYDAYTHRVRRWI